MDVKRQRTHVCVKHLAVNTRGISNTLLWNRRDHLKHITVEHNRASQTPCCKHKGASQAHYCGTQEIISNTLLWNTRGHLKHITLEHKGVFQTHYCGTQLGISNTLLHNTRGHLKYITEQQKGGISNILSKIFKCQIDQIWHSGDSIVTVVKYQQTLLSVQHILY